MGGEVERAEALGFTHAWFYDTQLLYADVFVCMALAARVTSRIRLGAGVLIPSNRISQVAAKGLATLTKLAPGRIDFGVGAGLTARRTMGPITLAELGRYAGEVRGPLRGETVDALLKGQKKKVRFMVPELGLIDLSHDIPVHLSAFGPKGRALGARLGAGWTFFSPATGPAISALNDMQASWRAAGEDVSVPPSMAQALDGYASLYDSYVPTDARWLPLHQGHQMYVRDDERRFLTEPIMQAMRFRGTEPVLLEPIETLRDAGYSQFTLQIVEGKEQALEDWVRVLGPSVWALGPRTHLSLSTGNDRGCNGHPL